MAADANVRLSYLAVKGRQTLDQAKLFVPTLAQQGCDVVVGVGEHQAAAVRELAATYADVAFLMVESDTDVAGVAVRVRDRVAG